MRGGFSLKHLWGGGVKEKDVVNVGDIVTLFGESGKFEVLALGLRDAMEGGWDLTLKQIIAFGVVNVSTIDSVPLGRTGEQLSANTFEVDDTNSMIESVESQTLPHLTHGSLIRDEDGVLGQGAKRNWMIGRTAENRRLVLDKDGLWKVRGASNYTLWPINKRTGDIGDYKKSIGQGARSVHRLLKRDNDIRLLRYGRADQKKDNLATEPDKDYSEFLESLSVQDWQK